MGGLGQLRPLTLCVPVCQGDERLCPLRKSGAHEEVGLCPLILREP